MTVEETADKLRQLATYVTTPEVEVASRAFIDEIATVGIYPTDIMNVACSLLGQVYGVLRRLGESHEQVAMYFEHATGAGGAFMPSSDLAGDVAERLSGLVGDAIEAVTMTVPVMLLSRGKEPSWEDATRTFIRAQLKLLLMSHQALALGSDATAGA